MDSTKPITKTEFKRHSTIIYEKQLIVLEKENLKEVVEYCIRTMPEQAIKDIRNTKKD